ncbi:unnamed protein product, partial [Hymenolepis diminuta]
ISSSRFLATHRLKIKELPEPNQAFNKTFVWNVPGNPLKDSRWIQHPKVLMGEFRRGCRIKWKILIKKGNQSNNFASLLYFIITHL